MSEQHGPIHKTHWMPSVLTLLLVAMVCGMVWALVMRETPVANKEVLFLIAGQIIGAFSTAVAYWIGSSRGSVEKQQRMDEKKPG